MKLFAPTISEAVLDVLNTYPCSEEFDQIHGAANGTAHWNVQYLCEQVESNYCVRGFAKGISKDCVAKALKGLKQKKLIRWDGSYVSLRIWSGKQSWTSQVRPLGPGDLISTEASKSQSLSPRRELPSRKAVLGHYVYYVQWENDPLYVKIGYSSRPAQRFVDFLTSNPHKLIVLRVQVVHHRDEEQVLHHEFKAFRQNREWFAYAGRLREHIEKLTCEPAKKIEKHLSPHYKEQIIIRSF